jgi:hypothetical protein
LPVAAAAFIGQVAPVSAVWAITAAPAGQDASASAQQHSFGHDSGQAAHAPASLQQASVPLAGQAAQSPWTGQPAEAVAAAFGQVPGLST